LPAGSLTDAEFWALRTLGIKSVLSFSSASESAWPLAQTAELSLRHNVRLLHFPLINDDVVSAVLSELSPAARGSISAAADDAERFERMAFSVVTELPVGALYRHIVEHAAPQIRAVFEALASEDSLPALLTCSQGKDRTGIVMALLLKALGAPEPWILADYSASLSQRVQHFQQLLRLAGVDESALDSNQQARDAFWMHSGVAPDALRAVLLETRAYGELPRRSAADTSGVAERFRIEPDVVERLLNLLLPTPAEAMYQFAEQRQQLLSCADGN
jgi:hypothetical protein